MNVFVTRNIPQSGINLLSEKGFNVTISGQDDVLTKEELIENLQANEYDAILSLLTDTIDKDILNAAPKLKIVSNYAVGFDNININDAKEAGIVVTNTPGVLTETVAEHTIALMLAITSRVVESDKFLRAGKYTGWEPELLLGTDLRNKNLIIIGAGAIGSLVAQIAHKGIGMNIGYYDIQPNEKIEKELNAKFYSNIDEAVKVADVISIHLPLLDSTKHLFNIDMFNKIKQGAYIVNTSRGPIIKEKDLVTALKSKHIRGAALDVFENEPEVEKELIEMDNTVLTPHTASATTETREKMSTLAAQNIIDVFEGREPKHRVV